MDSISNKPPRGLIIWGALSFLGTMLLAGRFIWEMVVWTHQRGEQMVGFTLLHTFPPPVIIFLVLSPLSCLIFIVVAYVHRRRARKKCVQPSKIVLSFSLLAAASVVLLCVPYSTWQQIMIWTLGPGPDGSGLMTKAAFNGNRSLVDSYISHGVDINARDHYDQTALMNAAKSGNIVLAQHLLDMGADLRAESLTGENVLTVAGEWRQLSFAREMYRKGARFVYSSYDGVQLDSLPDDQVLRLFSIEDSLRKASQRYQAGSDSIFLRIKRFYGVAPA